MEYQLHPSPLRNTGRFNVTVPFYEEGTWTPTVGGTATYNEQIGRYTRIGRICYIYFDMEIGAIGTGSTSVLSGLPFVASPVGAGIAGFGSGVCINFWSNLSAAYVYVAGRITPSNKHVIFETATAATTTLINQTAIFANNAQIVGSGVYEVF